MSGHNNSLQTFAGTRSSGRENRSPFTLRPCATGAPSAIQMCAKSKLPWYTMPRSCSTGDGCVWHGGTGGKRLGACMGGCAYCSMRVTMHQSAQPHEACGSYITLRCVCVQARKREARVRHQLRGYDCTGGHVSFTLLERGRVGMPVVLTAAGT